MHETTQLCIVLSTSTSHNLQQNTVAFLVCAFFQGYDDVTKSSIASLETITGVF